jgi:hypothetical protein
MTLVVKLGSSIVAAASVLRSRGSSRDRFVLL